MAYRDSRVTLQQQAGHRTADDLAATNDNRVGAGDFNIVSVQQLNDSSRRTGHKARTAHGQQPYVCRMKGINVLPGIDGLNDYRVIDLLRQWQLHEDAIYRV